MRARMAKIPRDPKIDGTLALLGEGYLFLPRRFARVGGDVVELRLVGVRFVALYGRDAAELFYDRTRFNRRGAVPKPVRRSLFGEGGVQSLDDAAHVHRKAMFLSLMSRDRIDHLMDEVWLRWYRALDRWVASGSVTLFDEAQDVLCAAACAWSGVPLAEDEVRARARDFTAMVDGFATLGPAHLRARWARRRTEKWIGDLIERIRAGELEPDERGAAHVIATHRDESGRLLDTRVASVELINVIRPIVAIATYVTFLAHALRTHPDWRSRLREGSDVELEAFVQEVRRLYPFTPFLGARVRESFEWRDFRFERGRRVLFDVYGTDHDPRIWTEPDVFRPERFRDWANDAYGFVPQGGGEHAVHHRCAGEWVTIEAMKVATAFLTRAISFRLPEQDTRIDMSRIPTRPRSGMTIAGIRATGDTARRPGVTRPEPVERA